MLTVAALHLLLDVLWAALMQPEQLLQEVGAMDSQSLTFADPTLERCLGRDDTAHVLTVV